MGGSGYDLISELPDEIETQIPDYELFKTNYSIGFTSRGCIRDCGFCIVREKEGAFAESDFKQDIMHSKYLIMDNNFFASKIWREKLEFFIDNAIKVNFHQGLDIRLMNEEKAQLLSQAYFMDWKFRKRKIYFAFDSMSLENLFRRKLEVVLKYIKPCYLMIYMLVGYDTSFDDDMYRFKVINSYKCDPFVMVYNNSGSRKLREFARWVNMRFHKKYSFREYLTKRNLWKIVNDLAAENGTTD